MTQNEIVQLAADLAECLREMRFGDDDMASYQDTIDAADAVLARATKAGLIPARD